MNAIVFGDHHMLSKLRRHVKSAVRSRPRVYNQLRSWPLTPLSGELITQEAARVVSRACEAAAALGCHVRPAVILERCRWLEDAIWNAEFQEDAVRQFVPDKLVPMDHKLRIVNLFVRETNSRDKCEIPAYMLINMQICIWRNHMLLSKYHLLSDPGGLQKSFLRELAHEACFGVWNDISRVHGHRFPGRLERMYQVERCLLRASAPLLEAAADAMARASHRLTRFALSQSDTCRRHRRRRRFGKMRYDAVVREVEKEFTSAWEVLASLRLVYL